jgi:tetratricopeptide (TPR) repeat protein
MSLEDLATTSIVAIVKNIAKPATQDVLVARVRTHPNSPPLNWRHRRRLRKLFSTDPAVAAMFEQDESGAAALSHEIAVHVFEEPESQRTLSLARAVIAELPGCLPAEQRDGLLAYRLRAIREAVEEVDLRVGDVGEEVRTVGSDVREVSQNVVDLREFLTARNIAPQLNPDVLIAGPLQALGLDSEYAAIQALQASDPASAAARLSNVISRIEAAGHHDEARPFVRQRAELLTRAGHFSAADAWLPLVHDFLNSGRGIGLHDATQAWNSLITNGTGPAWLGDRIAVTNALESWLYDDVSAAALLTLAFSAIDAGDPESTQWLVPAVESCLSDGRESSIAEIRDRILLAANNSHSIDLSARLLLAVADATGDDELWHQMLADAQPGGGRYALDLSALIHARRGRSLFWKGELNEALAEYRLAVDCGARSQIWDDAADWARSAMHIMQLGDSVNLTDLQSLQERENAFRSAGGGSLTSQANDLHLNALTYLVETESGSSSVRRAWGALSRYRRRSLIMGDIDQEIRSHGLTGRLHLQLGEPDAAIGHFIKAGDLGHAASTAGKLTRFHDCSDEIVTPLVRQRAVALRVAAEEADLIPDDQVVDWARMALTEAKKREFTVFGPEPYVNSYKLLEGLAPRFPSELIEELLEEIDNLLPREINTGTTVDDQIAQILIDLGSTSYDHRLAIAERMAVAFEQADDIADHIVPYAKSLSDVLRPVEDRLVALLPVNDDPQQRMRIMNTTMALVEIGNRSPTVLASADNVVESALNRPLAYSRNTVGRLAWVEEPAIIAKCLPVERRTALAEHYVERVLDGNDIERNRASFAVAFVNLAPHLSDELRNSIFTKLWPLAQDPLVSTNPFDIMEQQFRNPRGLVRVSGPPRRASQVHVEGTGSPRDEF